MNSNQWWQSVKADQEKMRRWLVRQYIGEVTAAGRIERLRNIAPAKHHATLTEIARQERLHAEWVGGLLTARGLPLPQVKDAEDRYWQQPLAQAHTFAELAAVGSHAEGMRLERIKAIVHDPESPKDVAAVFARILPDEVWHEAAFRAMTTPAHMESTRGAHELGKQALGLEA